MRSDMIKNIGLLYYKLKKVYIPSGSLSIAGIWKPTLTTKVIHSFLQYNNRPRQVYFACGSCEHMLDATTRTCERSSTCPITFPPHVYFTYIYNGCQLKTINNFFHLLDTFLTISNCNIPAISFFFHFLKQNVYICLKLLTSFQTLCRKSCTICLLLI